MNKMPFQFPTAFESARLCLHCDETNMRSIRVAERCSMLREGHLRENRRNPDGTFSGSYIYGLLEHEYRAV